MFANDWLALIGEGSAWEAYRSARRFWTISLLMANGNGEGIVRLVS
jgi:hypothetical protein